MAGDLVELALRQQRAGENAGLAWYSAGNWFFHAVLDYPAALRAYETAAEVQPDYRSQSYWLEETAAAMFETGDFAGAGRLLSEGVHPRVVMEVLGHSQMRTTTDTYSHVMPALGRDAADRMGKALWD